MPRKPEPTLQSSKDAQEMAGENDSSRHVARENLSERVSVGSPDQHT